MNLRRVTVVGDRSCWLASILDGPRRHWRRGHPSPISRHPGRTATKAKLDSCAPQRTFYILTKLVIIATCHCSDALDCLMHTQNLLPA